MSSSEDFPQPPPAPEIRRTLRLHRWQWLGVALLLLLPLLALFGLFGEGWGTARDRTAELSVEMRYPERNRYRMPTNLRVEVTNRTAATLRRVTIDVDTAYASRFSEVTSIPTFEYPYLIELTDLAPGETRRVQVELQGEDYGRHSGEIRVRVSGADTARLRLTTFIFP